MGEGQLGGEAAAIGATSSTAAHHGLPDHDQDQIYRSGILACSTSEASSSHSRTSSLIVACLSRLLGPDPTLPFASLWDLAVAVYHKRTRISGSIQFGSLLYYYSSNLFFLYFNF